MEIPSLFGDLRFIVIDEIHALLRGDRGLQTFCLIERLCRLAGCSPRRVGLSATIGNPRDAGKFLAAGSGRETVIPKFEAGKETWRLSMEHFFLTEPQAGELPPESGEGKSRKAPDGFPPVGTGRVPDHQRRREPPETVLEQQREALAGIAAEQELSGAIEAPGAVSEKDTEGREPFSAGVLANARTAEKKDGHLPGMEEEAPTDKAPVAADPGLGYIFEHTRGRKCLIFTNSREECEDVCQKLRQYCEANREPDRFLIHHGNLSASYRESAEEAMKDEDTQMSVCATATLELGIDIGRLERAFQIDAPFTVSGFLQRLGRTGRRGNPAEMCFVMREEHQEARAMLPDSIPWYLLQGIALVQLYIEERFVEPPRMDRLPYSLLYHQTMSTLASGGEMTAAELASRVLTLSCFQEVTKDDYKKMLRHLLEIDHINRTENGGLRERRPDCRTGGGEDYGLLQVLRGFSGK